MCLFPVSAPHPEHLCCVCPCGDQRCRQQVASRSPMGASYFLAALGPRVPHRAARGGQRENVPHAREGTVCTHFHQGFFDDSADVPPPLGDIRVVVVQVRREGQAKGSEFLWGYNSRLITQSPIVSSKVCYILHAKP